MPGLHHPRLTRRLRLRLPWEVPTMAEIGPALLEATFVLVGILLGITGVRSLLDKTNPRRFTTAAFWILLAITFAFGAVLPYWVTGVLLLLVGLLSLLRGVKVGKLDEGTAE